MDNSFLHTLSQTCKKNPIFSLFLSFFLYVTLSTILVQLLFVVVSLISGVSYESLLEIVRGNFSGESDTFILRFLQGVSQLLTWGLAALLMASLLGNAKEELNLRFSILPVFYVLTVPIIIFTIPIVELTTFDLSNFQLPSFLKDWEEWVHESELKQQKILIALLFDAKLSTFISNLLVFALIPAITEELFFRGFLQKTLSRYGIHVGIWIASLLASLVHFQFYGFFSRLLLGAILGYLTYGAGSILPAMLGHFVFNAFTISALYQAALQHADPEKVMSPDQSSLPLYGVLITFVGVTGLFILYFRYASIQKTLDV